MSPQLQVEEAATGTGDLCGSIALNARFAEFAEKRIGKLGASDMNEVRYCMYLIREESTDLM
jgi:hypothetical protein